MKIKIITLSLLLLSSLHAVASEPEYELYIKLEKALYETAKKYKPEKRKLSIFSIIESDQSDQTEVATISDIITAQAQSLSDKESPSVIFGQPTHIITLRTELAGYYSSYTCYLRVTATDTINPHSLFPFDDNYNQAVSITAIKQHLKKLSYVRAVLSKKEYDALSNQK